MGPHGPPQALEFFGVRPPLGPWPPKLAKLIKKDRSTKLRNQSNQHEIKQIRDQSNKYAINQQTYLINQKVENWGTSGPMVFHFKNIYIKDTKKHIQNPYKMKHM